MVTKRGFLSLVLVGIVLLAAALPVLASHQWSQFEDFVCDPAAQALSFTAVYSGGDEPGLEVDIYVDGVLVYEDFELWSDSDSASDAAGTYAFTIIAPEFTAGVEVRLVSDNVDTAVTCSSAPAVEVEICATPRPAGFEIRSIPARALEKRNATMMTPMAIALRPVNEEMTNPSAPR